MDWIKTLAMDKETFFVAFNVYKHKDDSRPYQWLHTADGHGYSVGGSGIYFYSEADAVQFALRFS